MYLKLITLAEHSLQVTRQAACSNHCLTASCSVARSLSLRVDLAFLLSHITLLYTWWFRTLFPRKRLIERQEERLQILLGSLQIARGA